MATNHLTPQQQRNDRAAYLQAASAGLFSVTDGGGFGASLATAYAAGEALRDATPATADGNGGDDSDDGDDHGDDSDDDPEDDPVEGRGGWLGWALLALMTVGATFAAAALYATSQLGR